MQNGSAWPGETLAMLKLVHHTLILLHFKCTNSTACRCLCTILGVWAIWCVNMFFRLQLCLKGLLPVKWPPTFHFIKKQTNRVRQFGALLPEFTCWLSRQNKQRWEAAVPSLVPVGFSPCTYCRLIIPLCLRCPSLPPHFIYFKTSQHLLSVGAVVFFLLFSVSSPSLFLWTV